MLKQLQERGTSLSGYKPPLPSSSSTERAFSSENKENLPSGFWKKKLVAIGTVYSKKQYI